MPGMPELPIDVDARDQKTGQAESGEVTQTHRGSGHRKVDNNKTGLLPKGWMQHSEDREH